jgi:hypothetical protein
MTVSVPMTPAQAERLRRLFAREVDAADPADARLFLALMDASRPRRDGRVCRTAWGEVPLTDGAPARCAREV